MLHQAIGDALDPSQPPRDYYAVGPAATTAATCAASCCARSARSPACRTSTCCAPHFAQAALLYAKCRRTNTIPPGERERRCVAWYEQHRDRYGDIDWHEFASAAGSQFHVYGPLFEAFAGRRDAIARAYDAYFPYVSALHVCSMRSSIKPKTASTAS